MVKIILLKACLRGISLIVKCLFFYNSTSNKNFRHFICIVLRLFWGLDLKKPGYHIEEVASSFKKWNGMVHKEASLNCG